MKNKNILLILSRWFKIDETKLQEAFDADGGDDSILKDKFQVYTPAELATLLKNSNEAYLENTDLEVGKIPKKLYSKVADAVLESKEKELAKTHAIDKWSGLSDLVSKITDKIKSGINSTSEEKDTQITTLKQTIETMKAEHGTALEAEKGKLTAELTTRDFNSSLTGLGLDYEGEALQKQSTLFSNAFNAEYNLITKDGKTIVTDKKGKAITNNLGDGLPINEVLKTFADNYGFKIKQPDTGGRGTGGSDPSTTNNYKGKTFEEILKAKNIQQNTDAADKLFEEWNKQNPKT